MAKLLNHVQPGDLITADMWNDLVDSINNLLKASRNISIAAVSPRGTEQDPIRIGGIVQITGQNFGYAAGSTKVIFEGAPDGDVIINHSDLITGSSDERLLFFMPPVPRLNATGLVLTMRVSNGVADDISRMLVMPVFIPLDGDIFVTWNQNADPNPNPNPINPDQSAQFGLTLQTVLTRPSVITLSCDIKDPTAALPADFIQKIEFRSDTGAVITNKSIEMGKTETRGIFVLLPPLPTNFANQTFTLVVTAAAGGRTGIFSQSFTVGAAVPKPDPSITPRLTAVQVLDPNGNTTNDPANGSFDGSTIQVKANFQLIFHYSLDLTDQSNYDLTFLPKENTTLNDWGNGPVGTPATIAGPVTGRLIKIGVLPKPGATADGTLVFRIRKPGATQDWNKEIKVHLLG